MNLEDWREEEALNKMAGLQQERSINPLEEEEPAEEVMVAEAIVKAKQAFADHLSEVYNYDMAYFRLKFVVEHLDASFSEILARTTYEEVG